MQAAERGPRKMLGTFSTRQTSPRPHFVRPRSRRPLLGLFKSSSAAFEIEMGEHEAPKNVRKIEERERSERSQRAQRADKSAQSQPLCIQRCQRGQRVLLG
jgi:hypothetical protein